MLRFALLTALALTLLQAGDDGRAAKDLKQLQGTWTMANLEVNGQVVGADKLAETTVTIDGSNYTVRTKDRTLRCRIQLDPGKDPKEIDMLFEEPGGGLRVHKGIYKIENDTFQIARGLNTEQGRPNQFATWPDTNYFVVTWKRQ